MSPELLRNQSKDKRHLSEYDPRSVDVWASGVMLLVAMCGAFPFDHTRQHQDFNDDEELDLWCGAPFPAKVAKCFRQC
jgi:serine/threonine-protein kinase SRK2